LFPIGIKKFQHKKYEIENTKAEKVKEMEGYYKISKF